MLNLQYCSKHESSSQTEITKKCFNDYKYGTVECHWIWPYAPYLHKIIDSKIPFINFQAHIFRVFQWNILKSALVFPWSPLNYCDSRTHFKSNGVINVSERNSLHSILITKIVVFVEIIERRSLAICSLSTLCINLNLVDALSEFVESVSELLSRPAKIRFVSFSNRDLLSQCCVNKHPPANRKTANFVWVFF